MHGSTHCHICAIYPKKEFLLVTLCYKTARPLAHPPQGPKMTLWAPLGPGPSFMAVPSREVGARYCAPVLTNPHFVARGSKLLHNRCFPPAQSIHMDGPGPRQPRGRPLGLSTTPTDTLGYMGPKLHMHIPVATLQLSSLCLPDEHTAWQIRSSVHIDLLCEPQHGF